MFRQREIPIHPLPTMIGGLNDQMSPDEIMDYEMADCENFSIEEGSIITSPGYVAWDDNMTGSPASNQNFGPYYGIYTFKRSNGYFVTIRQRQDKLEYALYGDDTWMPCTMPTAGSPATTVTLQPLVASFVTLNNIVLFSNGYDSVMSSEDGITWTLRASLPKSRRLINNGKNRVLFVAQPDDFSKISWSNINDPLTVDASAWQYIDPNNGQDIVTASLTPDGTTLIHKEGSIYSVSDYLDNGIIDVNYIGSVTTVSPHAVVTTENSVIWMGADGFYEYIGGTIRKISGKIKVSGRNKIFLLRAAVAAYYNSKVHISIPDADISQEYNSQEYIIYKNIPRQDPEQPYAITRNRRYFGCYGIEDYEDATGRYVTLYAADSTSGNNFCFINDYRDSSYLQGLNGSSQPAYFVTKYFTENIPYYAKRFKKFFTNLKVEQDLTVNLGYRFQPYGEWNEVVVSFTAGSMPFSEGFGFDEGFDFSYETAGQTFIDLENIEKPRGIQFKISTNQINDVRFLDFAFSYIVKGKFK